MMKLIYNSWCNCLYPCNVICQEINNWFKNCLSKKFKEIIDNILNWYQNITLSNSGGKKKKLGINN